jgi:hypothetical protein
VKVIRPGVESKTSVTLPPSSVALGLASLLGSYRMVISTVALALMSSPSMIYPLSPSAETTKVIWACDATGLRSRKRESSRLASFTVVIGSPRGIASRAGWNRLSDPKDASNRQ